MDEDKQIIEGEVTEEVVEEITESPTETEDISKAAAFLSLEELIKNHIEANDKPTKIV